jgi:hypothetical protein
LIPVLLPWEAPHTRVRKGGVGVGLYTHTRNTNKYTIRYIIDIIDILTTYSFPCIADRLTLYTYCILVLQANIMKVTPSLVCVWCFPNSIILHGIKSLGLNLLVLSFCCPTTLSLPTPIVPPPTSQA